MFFLNQTQWRCVGDEQCDSIRRRRRAADGEYSADRASGVRTISPVSDNLGGARGMIVETREELQEGEKT